MAIPKFQFGDEVNNVKLGLPSIGRICGILRSGQFRRYVEEYFLEMNNMTIDWSIWSKAYPKWEVDGWVYLIESESGQASISPEQDLRLVDIETIF